MHTEISDPIAQLLLEISRAYAAAPTLAVPVALETALEKAAPLLQKHYGHRRIQIPTRLDYWKGDSHE